MRLYREFYCYCLFHIMIWEKEERGEVGVVREEGQMQQAL